jgi:hypothetical protein
MTWMGPESAEDVIVPDLIGLTVRAARTLGTQAGVALAQADPDGPPLGALTWPGTWIVTAQRPGPGSVLHRWGSVVVDFAPGTPGEESGDREPRRPVPPSTLRSASRDQAEDTDPARDER